MKMIALFASLLILATPSALATSSAANQTPLIKATTRIKHEANYVQWVLAQYGRKLPRGRVLALAALTYVQGVTSAPAYGYRLEISHDKLPGIDVNEIIEMQAGICGNAYELYSEMLRTVGVQVRSVQFWYQGGDHIAAEVKWGGKWHYMDPTWGAYFQVKDRGILSIREVRALPIKTGVKAEVSNQSLLWNQIVRVAKIDPMAERYAALRRDVRIEIGKAD
jgi:hypothetical protein